MFGTVLCVLVARRSQFDLYLLSFSSPGSTFNCFKIFYIPFLVKKCVPAVRLGNLISIDVSRFFNPIL
jgi:hypothetical protein